MNTKLTEEKAAAPEADRGSFRNANLLTVLLAVLVLVVVFNQMQIGALSAIPIAKLGPVAAFAAAAPGAVPASASASPYAAAPGAAPAPVAASVTLAEIVPTGVPAIYGAELNLKYDDISSSNPNVQATINRLSAMENSIQMDSAQMARYVKTGSMIACEYCCGANTLVFPNGQPACGCAHSASMRGLLKYLVTKHPEMSDEQLLEEMGKWKTLFFPGPIAQKAGVLKSQGIALNYINLASNKYRGAEKGAAIAAGGTASQVGGC